MSQAETIETFNEYARPVSPEQDLAIAVINQAVEDAENPIPSHQRLEARKFLCAYRKAWGDSLASWCEVAGLSDNLAFLIRKARERYYINGEIQW